MVKFELPNRAVALSRADKSALVFHAVPMKPNIRTYEIEGLVRIATLKFVTVVGLLQLRCRQRAYLRSICKRAIETAIMNVGGPRSEARDEISMDDADTKMY